MKNSKIILPLFLGGFLFMSCEDLAPGDPEGYEDLDEPLEGLSVEGQRQHSDGDTQFDKVYTAEEGLGPVFNNVSCNSCHPEEGKGHPNNAFKRFGQSVPGLNKGHDEDLNPYAVFGDGLNQLQDRAIPGYEPEELPDGAPYSEFVAPNITGLGYLDAVPDSTLIAMAEQNEQTDGPIKGRPHYRAPVDYVTPRSNSIPNAEGELIHRFGKKALTYDLFHQTVGAFNQDMGIVTSYSPIEPFDGEKGDPEASNQTVKDVAFYLKTLKAPERHPNKDDAQVRAGEALFEEINCAACHKPTLKTGPSDIPTLDNVEFHPYTDLLLHDMGPDLDDGYTEGNVETSEWRTPPLWAIGIQKDEIQGGTYYLLHDGRANSIEEAISYHGGEAAESRDLFDELSDEEQKQLVEFIESL